LASRFWRADAFRLNFALVVSSVIDRLGSKELEKVRRDRPSDPMQSLQGERSISLVYASCQAPSIKSKYTDISTLHVQTFRAAILRH
jgi:hypothetical protein